MIEHFRRYRFSTQSSPTFLVLALHRGPGDTECGFLPARIMGVRGVGVIEGLAEDVLSVFGQMRTDGRRQVGVDRIGHGCSLPLWRKEPHPGRGRINQQ